MATTLFTAVDFIVLGASFVLSALIGIYFAVSGRKENNTATYFLGDRQMGVLPIAISYMATAISAVVFIGVPSEVYFFGPNILLTIPGRIFAIYIVTRTAVPIYYRLKLTSIYEYLEMRFDKSVKIAGIIIYYVFATVYMGFVVYAPALALSLITGMSVVLSILVVTLICSFYTTIGGMKAVIWTDVLQVGLYKVKRTQFSI
ncbi:Sodium-dependent multivitamin transporter [Apostichopus japonicus]|uniref:Sodium-dependent multivitamin transporter n=1 Tax=Stichopus japonicus TaxID=307972 RepID=A0A2G8KAP8_STIJA|nr:Sodium-dependent multivitamin transporter [Apostichopus japonicus]